ncbi:hypothetical protein BGZ94_004777 [Podila epigama]|nr:hypothetical protein BGZ94_004777 [Podila epigama]
MQQPSQRPLIAEVEQLKRSIDSMNSQTAEMLKYLDNMRNIGADHIALPSTEQEKLDREWEYFETVCDQENSKYKLKRQQAILTQQLAASTASNNESPQPSAQPLPEDSTASSLQPTTTSVISV